MDYLGMIEKHEIGIMFTDGHGIGVSYGGCCYVDDDLKKLLTRVIKIAESEYICTERS